MAMYPLLAPSTQNPKKGSLLNNTITSVNDEISVQLDDNLRVLQRHQEKISRERQVLQFELLFK